MKFSKQLLYNAVAEWREFYMDYGGLKKYVSQLKKLKAEEDPAWEAAIDEVRGSSNDEGMPLLARPSSPRMARTASAKVLNDLEAAYVASNGRSDKPDAYGGVEGHEAEAKFAAVSEEFFGQLRKNAEKCEGFYERMKSELEIITNTLIRQAAAAEKKGPQQRRRILSNLRRRYVEHYLEVAELLNFAEMNKTGFEKIMKKHDKVTMTHRKDAFMRELLMYKFTHPGELEGMRQEVEEEFARCYWNDDRERAKQELHESLRELVIWERNTIWRDMILSERRVQAVTAKKTGQEMSRFWAQSLKPTSLLLSVTVALTVLILSPRLFSLCPNISLFKPDVVHAAERCLCLVVFVSMMWASEAVPLYVTALSVPLLSIMFRVYLNDKGGPMPAVDAAKLAITSMSSPVILLIIGGYSLAAALSKHALDKAVATAVLVKAGRPSQLLLLLMLLAVSLSMFISNVATPVLLNSLMLPILRGFPPTSLPFVKCLVIGIALASNIGGMGTPIASPQNAIALSALEGMQQISFLQWCAVSIPLMLIMVLSCHALLMAWYQPGRYSLPIIPSHMEPFAAPHYLIIGTLVSTVALWCCKPAVRFVGSEGLISCIPILVFFGSGLLSKEDFNHLPWNVIYLVAGGVALGSAVESSQLLRIVSGAISLALGSSSLWTITAVFCCFIFVVSSMTSHTVSAIIIMPLLSEVGASLGHPRLLVMGGALACSCAMALPVSSFPNTASVSVENEVGKAYIHPADIVKLGVQMTAIAAVVLLTFGYGIMLLLGF